MSMAFSLFIMLQFEILLLLDSSNTKIPLLKSFILQFLTLLLDPCILIPCLFLLNPDKLQSETELYEDLMSIATPLLSVFITQLEIVQPSLSGSMDIAYSPVLII